MRSIRALVGTVIVAAVTAWTTLPAQAQEISDSHLAAALAAFRASQPGADFNTVLPDVADQVIAAMVQQRPDLFQQIETVVYDTATEMASRRADLNNDISRLWAQNFSEEELMTITAFYQTSAGQKLANTGDVLLDDTLTVVENWSDRLAEDLLNNSIEELAGQGIEF